MPYIKYGHRPTRHFWQSIWSELDLDARVNTISDSNNPLKGNLLKHLSRQNRILDAGCGIGEWAIFLKEQKYDVVGLDFESETIQRLSRVYPDIEWKLGDVLNLPFDDNSFDVYLSLGVLEHLEGKFIQGVKEARRVLKPNGLLFLLVPYYSGFRRILRSYTKIRDDLPFYQYYFEERELSKILRANWFEIIRVFKADAIWGLLGELPYIDRLYLMFQKRISPKSKTSSESRKESKSVIYQMLKLLHDPINNSFLLEFCAHRIGFVARASKVSSE